MNRQRKKRACQCGLPRRAGKPELGSFAAENPRRRGSTECPPQSSENERTASLTKGARLAKPVRQLLGRWRAGTRSSQSMQRERERCVSDAR